MPDATDAPWYSEGLRFACQQCGGCCSGAPGYVWVGEEEIASLAKCKEMTPVEFVSTFVRLVGGSHSLRERPGGDCILLDESTRACSVYENRPVQCRTWPWWPENLESAQHWRNQRRNCPGIDQGDVHSFLKIQRELAKSD